MAKKAELESQVVELQKEIDWLKQALMLALKKPSTEGEAVRATGPTRAESWSLAQQPPAKPNLLEELTEAFFDISGAEDLTAPLEENSGY